MLFLTPRSGIAIMTFAARVTSARDELGLQKSVLVILRDSELIRRHLRVSM